jgi:hypothetical protein
MSKNNAERMTFFDDPMDKISAIADALGDIAEQLSGFHTGNPKDNPLLGALHRQAVAQQNIATALFALATALAPNDKVRKCVESDTTLCAKLFDKA